MTDPPTPDPRSPTPDKGSYCRRFKGHSGIHSLYTQLRPKDKGY